MKKITYLVSLCLFGLMPLLASAENRDQPEISMTRTSQSGLQLNGALNKNVYRYVTRIETYTVEVPYQVAVQYWDWETYYTQEYRCEYRRVPYQVCTQKQVCNRRDEGTRPPGGGGGGNHPPGGGGGNHPPGGGGGGSNCHMQTVCHTAYRTEQYCHWISVPHTRQVLRTRLETRYRTETRERTVVDQIFDHQWGVGVRILFPAGTELQGDETETALVQLQGMEAQPDVLVQINSSIFNYRVVDKQLQGREFVVRLESFARYEPSDLSEKTISGLTLMSNNDGTQAQVKFKDQGLVARVSTQYQIWVVDAVTGGMLAELYSGANFGAKEILVPLNAVITPDRDLNIKLRVERTGSTISGGHVLFETSTLRKGMLDMAIYSQINAVGEFRVQGTERNAVISFMDRTPRHKDVKTSYSITIRRGGSQKEVLAQQTLSQEQFLVQADGRLAIAAAQFPGITPKMLDQHFNRGDTQIYEVLVIRSSERFTQEIRFPVAQTIKVEP